MTGTNQAPWELRAPAGLHDALVAGYRAKHPQFQTHGFRRAFRQRFPYAGRDALAAVSMVPDAFCFELDGDRAAEGGTLTIVEAVVTHPIDRSKLEKLMGLYWWLDGGVTDDFALRGPPDDEHHEPWSLELHLITETGGVVEVDVFDVAYQFINTPFERLPKFLRCPRGALIDRLSGFLPGESEVSP